jgi:hypothetical protein
MKKLLLTLLLLLPLSAFYAFEVNIIMNDGSVIKGNMLGKTADEIFLDGENGKAKIIKIADIKNVFDAEKGTPVAIKASQSLQASTNAQNQPVLTNVPGSDVYYYYYNGEPLYYYGGFWWRYDDGIWLRSPYYAGPWVIIGAPYVPGPVFYIGPRWYYWGPRWGWGWRWGWHRW